MPTESPTLRVTGSIPVGTTRAANTRLPLIIRIKIGTKAAQLSPMGFFPVLARIGKKKKCLSLTR